MRPFLERFLGKEEVTQWNWACPTGRGAEAGSLCGKDANPRWKREEAAAFSVFVACAGGEGKGPSADSISVPGCSQACKNWLLRWLRVDNPAGVCAPGVAVQPSALTSAAQQLGPEQGRFRDCWEKNRSIFRHRKGALCKDFTKNPRRKLYHSQKLQERQWLKSTFLNGHDLIARQIPVPVRTPNVTSMCPVAFTCLCSLHPRRDQGHLPGAGLSSRAPGRGRQEPPAVGRARCLQVLQQEQPLQGMALHCPQLIVPEHSARGHRDIVTAAAGQQQLGLSWENLLQQLDWSISLGPCRHRPRSWPEQALAPGRLKLTTAWSLGKQTQGRCPGL